MKSIVTSFVIDTFLRVTLCEDKKFKQMREKKTRNSGTRNLLTSQNVYAKAELISFSSQAATSCNTFLDKSSSFICTRR